MFRLSLWSFWVTLGISTMANWNDKYEASEILQKIIKNVQNIIIFKLFWNALTDVHTYKFLIQWINVYQEKSMKTVLKNKKNLVTSTTSNVQAITLIFLGYIRNLYNGKLKWQIWSIRNIAENNKKCAKYNHIWIILKCTDRCPHI